MEIAQQEREQLYFAWKAAEQMREFIRWYGEEWQNRSADDITQALQRNNDAHLKLRHTIMDLPMPQLQAEMMLHNMYRPWDDIEPLLQHMGVLPERAGTAQARERHEMSFADRLMHTFESVMAFPFGFLFGYDNSPEPQWNPPQEQVTPREADARPQDAAPEPTIAPAEPVQAQETAPDPAARLQEQMLRLESLQERLDAAWKQARFGEQAQEPNHAAERLAEQRVQQTRLQERMEWEQNYMAAQEQQAMQTRADALRGRPDDRRDLTAVRDKEQER